MRVHLMTCLILQGPTSKYHHFGIRVSTYECWRDTKHSVQSSRLPSFHPNAFPFEHSWCKSHAAKGHLVCSLHTSGIYFPWKSFPALDLESFLRLPNSVFCKWLSVVWSLSHTVSCQSDNHLATQFAEKRKILSTESSLISLLILTTLAFSSYHKT